MYNSYYSFSDSPFENNFDQRFLYLSKDHNEVLAALLYFIKEEKAFALLCGDVGTGKTMLINCFIARLPESVTPVIISNPTIEYLEILHYLARQLGISRAHKTVLELIDEVKNTLLEEKKGGRRYFLIIDEAHLLTDQSLEHIRLLSNIETIQEKLLQILLVGQYELSYKLDRLEMRQLRQRISINRFLSTLDTSETTQYIDHRLKVVGSSFDICFTPDCKQLLYQLTGGVPRLINQICDNALLICKAERLAKIDKRTLKKSDEALRSDLIFTPKFSDGAHRKSPRVYKRVASIAAVSICMVLLMLILFLSYSAYFTKNTDHNVSSRSTQPPSEASTKQLHPQSASHNTSSEFSSEELTTTLELRAFQKPIAGDAGDIARTEIKKDPLLTPVAFKSKDLPIIFPAQVKGNEIYFTIQVHALSREDDAIAEMYSLRKKNYPAFIIQTKNLKGTPVRKVRIGKYRTKADAEEIAHFLRHREKIPYLIIKSKIALPQQFTSNIPLPSLPALERKTRAPENSGVDPYSPADSLTQAKSEKAIKQLLEEHTE